MSYGLQYFPKVENGGVTNYGKYSAAEINTTVNMVTLGWIQAPGTWSYGTSNFQATGDYTGTLYNYLKIKWAESGIAKYALIETIVFAGGTTTITPIGTLPTSYDADSLYFSISENPAGWPGWFDFVPDIRGSTGSAGTFAQTIYRARFEFIGRTFHAQLFDQLSNLGSWSGQVLWYPPVINLAAYYYAPLYIIPTGGLVPAAEKGQASYLGATSFGFNKTGGATLLWSDLVNTDFIVGEAWIEI